MARGLKTRLSGDEQLTICLVTARAGSKRIPSKNTRVFAGEKPIIQFAVEALLQSGVVDEVLVDTDSPTIAKAASDFGASVPYIRDPDLATDEATTSDVVRGAISRLGLGTDEDLLVVYPTNVMSPELYEEANIAFRSKSAEFLVSMALVASDAQNLLYGRLGEPAAALDKDAVTSGQKVTGNLYRDAGKFYWGTCGSWLTIPNPLLSADPFVVSGVDAIDINTFEDWARAEALYLRNSRGS